LLRKKRKWVRKEEGWRKRHAKSKKGYWNWTFGTSLGVRDRTKKQTKTIGAKKKKSRVLSKKDIGKRLN